MTPTRSAVVVLLSLAPALVTAQISTISLPTAVASPGPVFTPDAVPYGYPDPPACQNVSIAMYNSPEWSSDGSPNSDVVLPPLLPAALAHDCLTSLPVRQSDALGVVDYILAALEFQSNVEDLRSPPDSYVPGNPPIDVVAEVQAVRSTVLDNGYENELEFEDALSTLLNRAYDGHLAFAGPANFFTFTWLRDPRLTLASVVQGRDALPQIYRVADLNQTGSSASPVVQINGQNATDFLTAEAELQSFHDPDARWNSIFFSMAGGPSYGYFIEPPSYPGPNTTLTFRNGSSVSYPNYAEALVNPYSLSGDGDFVYDQIVVLPSDSSDGIFSASTATTEAPADQLDAAHPPTTRFKKTKKRFPFGRPPSRNLPKLPPLDHGEQHAKRDVPYGYPEPYITQSDTDDETVFLSGYFAPYDGNPSGLAILALQSFLVLGDPEFLNFQRTVADFLAEAQRRDTRKMIVDLSWNSGGTALLAYETFRQFFPDQGFATTSRFRASAPLDALGRFYSDGSYYEGVLFSKYTWFKPSGDSFSSWSSLYGPHDFGAGSYTSALQVDMCDAYDTQAAPLGFNATGCGSGPVPPRPFASEDLVILTNGICASACALFKQFMSTQGNVPSVALGGRQQDGPMQAVGATRGGVVLLSPQLDRFVALYDQYRSASDPASSAAGLRPPMPIQALLSVNSQNQYAKGSDVPLQFVQDPAGCRLFLTDDMALDVGAIWDQVARAAWSGSDGGIDAGSCVSGSVVQEQGKGEDATASTNGGSGNDLNNDGGSGAADSGGSSGGSRGGSRGGGDQGAGAARDTPTRGLLAALAAVSLSLPFALF